MLGVAYIVITYFKIHKGWYNIDFKFPLFSLQNGVQQANTMTRKRIFAALVVMDRTNPAKAPSPAWLAPEDKPLELQRLYLRLSVETIVLQVNLPASISLRILLRYLYKFFSLFYILKGFFSSYR